MGVVLSASDWLLGILVLFAGVVASITLFVLAFAGLVGGAVKGTTAVAKKVRKSVGNKVKARRNRK